MFYLSVCSLTYYKQNPDSCLRTSESWYALNASDPDLNKCCCLAFCTIQFVKQIIVNAVISGLLSVTPNNHVKIFCETRSDPVFSYYKSLCLKIPSCKSDYIIYNQMIFVRSNHTHMNTNGHLEFSSTDYILRICKTLWRLLELAEATLNAFSFDPKP